MRLGMIAATRQRRLCLAAAVITGGVAASAACGDGDVGSLASSDPRRNDGGNIADAMLGDDTSTSGREPGPFEPVDLNHVLSTGQSLSVGVAGSPPLSTVQPFSNVMFGSGVMSETSGLDRFVPLVEGDTVEDQGASKAVETMSSAMANLVTRIAQTEVFVDRPEDQRAHDVLVSVHGVSGARYAQIKKGTAAYAQGMAQVAAARDLAKAAGKSYVVRAITTVHGETDHVMGTASYEANLLEWQADYEADIATATGQPRPIPLLETQMSSWTVLGSTTSTIPAAQLAAHVASAGKVVLVGPKYHLAYAPDGLHLSNVGYRHMGEDYAKVYRRIVFEGKRWEPVRPRSISRTGASVTMMFHVPSPPLVIDTKLVSDPGNRGFEYVDGTGSPPSIVNVEVTAPETVVVTLSAPPKVANGRIRYAYRGGKVNVSAGPTTGPRGNLRDSDGTVSRSGNPLYNWCVHFDESIP